MKESLRIQEAVAPGIDDGYATYIRLWYAVLRQALADLSDRADPVEREDALAWIESNAVVPGSFLWLSQILDFDPAKVRIACQDKEILRAAKRLVTQLGKGRKVEMAVAAA